MIVLQYAEHGNLRNYLIQNYNKFKWVNKIYILHNISNGLHQIHRQGLIHRNLHSGNILRLKYETSITDIGLCKPADALENKVYGVLPYMAPEILRGQNYTKASDIYSFGIIMYEVISGLLPYHNVSHNKNLAIKVCQGFRPRFNIKVPQLILHLIKQCLDANPLIRPTADTIWNTILQWHNDIQDDDTEIYKQIKEVEEINNNLSTNIITLKHSEAIYTSRLLDFNNLPESKNSDDYYTQYDNIGRN
jgi:serine/threonine protein kinase